MELGEERMDEAQLSAMPTLTLVKHALTEAQLLARAEVAHAKFEISEEIGQIKNVAVYAVGAIIGAAVAIGLLLMGIACLLPLPTWAGALIFGVLAAGGAGWLGYAAYKRLPSNVLAETTKRLKKDFELAKEELR